ncbi:hypothetical protein LTR53_001982 [Teratosphaeriaceae sp. CCFEE 6253]|nr:hypothetical protein LTR53_001982 [Teratosphaeriaceae sp. CCFEE 6253]
MSPSPAQLPSPCATELDRDSSAPPDLGPAIATANMLKIHALLNPADQTRMRESSISHPPTPAPTQASSTASTPVPQTPLTATGAAAKRQKLVKDAAIFVRGTAKEPIGYPPFECTEDAICLSHRASQELAEQHERYAVFPSGRGDEGLISDYQRHIPYSSEKKAFQGLTNRDAFEVFQYTFRVPGDQDRKEHVVMWDYQVGLVRITPFFKALKYSKTTPAKALTTNAGLKDLAHSITGGALAAQGYWMPYACARALCLTFCYPIRWALTPIFGPSFIKECLPDSHPAFGRFRISGEVVRCAQLEAEGWRSEASSRAASPVDANGYQAAHRQEIPRSVPLLVPAPQRQASRSRPTFKAGSPFASDSEAADNSYTCNTNASIESPHLSPKSTRHHRVSRAWTSVNRPAHVHVRSAPPCTPPPPPDNTPVGSLSHALLTEPRTLPTTSWREVEERLGGAAEQRKQKRRLSVHGHHDIDDGAAPPEDAFSRTHYHSDDDVETHPTRMATKRQRREETPAPPSGSQRPLGDGSTTPPSTGTDTSTKCTKYNAADARAAQWLLNLSVRDSRVAYGPAALEGREQDRGMGRKGSEV